MSDHLAGGRRRRLLLRFLAFAAILSLPTRTAAAAAEVSCEADGTCSAAAEESSTTPGSSSSDGSDGDDVAELPSDPCVDTNPSCGTWASDGECKNNPGYMLTKCARSCGACPPLDKEERRREEEEIEPPHGCADLHEMCWRWAEEGECVVNPKYMEKACRDSCMLCIDMEAARAREDDEDYIRRKRLFMNLDTGAPQQIPPDIDEDETYRLKSLLRSVDEYSKGYLLDETTPDTVRDRCKNAFGLCSHWAERGMCTDKVVYMLNSCPLACRICDRTEQFHRCAGRRHPEEKAAFGGDGEGIDGVFKAIKTGKFDQYGPEFLTEPAEAAAGGDGSEEGEKGKDDGDGAGDSGDPYLVRFENFLTAEEADRLVKLGDEIAWTESLVDEAESGAVNSGQGVPRRTSDSAFCHPDQPCESDDVYRTVMGRISDVLGGVSSDHLEGMELVRYGPRGSYGVHHDARIHDSWKPAGLRVLTVLLILTDMDEGGATGFPDLDWLFVKAKKGSALLWSNVKLDDPTEADPRMVHEGLPVVNGEKYAANVWVHQYNWRKAQERDCI